MDTAVVKCYPDGKMKAAILSFDDSAESHDRVMVNVLRKHGLNASKQVVISTSGNTVTVNNPSTVDVWVKVWGNAYAIHPGQTQTYNYTPANDFAVTNSDYTPASYDINLDSNMSVSGSGSGTAVNGTSLVTLKKGLASTVILQPDGSNYQQFQIKQTMQSNGADYILLGSTASKATFLSQKLTVIDLKYKLKLDDYT